MDYYFEKQRAAAEAEHQVEKPAEKEEPKEGLELTETTLAHLDETRKWAMFIGVYNIAIAGLLLLFALFIL